jgi:hypothetical protein
MVCYITFFILFNSYTFVIMLHLPLILNTFLSITGMLLNIINYVLNGKNSIQNVWTISYMLRHSQSQFIRGKNKDKTKLMYISHPTFHTHTHTHTYTYTHTRTNTYTYTDILHLGLKVILLHYHLILVFLYYHCGMMVVSYNCLLYYIVL